MKINLSLIIRRVQIKIAMRGPGQVAQLVRALSRYIKVAGSIPGQGTYKKQPVNA